MKSLIIQFVCAALILSVAPSCSKQNTAGEKTLYSCSMHPQIIQDRPGECPVCGMKLVPLRQDASAAAQGKQAGNRKIKYYKSTMLLGEISQTPRKDSMGMDMIPVYESEDESQAIHVDPVTVQKMGVRTAPVTKGALRRVIRTVGSIDYNETALADVTTKFRGWIENLYVDSTGKEVHKGEPLFDIYSPELYSAQNEYVLALNQSGGGNLKSSARQKLKLFDISEDQIAGLEKTRQPQRTLRVNAPIDGVVVDKMAIKGQMVDAGMKLYRLADLGIVWVQSQIYEQDLALLQVGQEAEVSLSYLPDRKFQGRITYIYPTVDEKTRTAKVRMEFHNPGFFLKPGMFATVEIHAELEPRALLVPDASILRSGDSNTVFVALGNGKFEPRTVTLGPRGENDEIQVLSGVSEGERVVTSGQFMLDSESQLREAIQKMLNPNATPSPAPQREHAMQSASPAAIAATTGLQSGEYVCPTEYSCPMPEHMSISYNHPGKCPICGMTLIPKPQEKSAAPPPSASPVAPKHQD
jgi:multidrug efflux pump subunit AcrA (membrane-fusion protein)